MTHSTTTPKEAALTPAQRHYIIDRMATLLLERQPKNESTALTLLRALEFPEWQIEAFLPDATKRFQEMDKGII